MKYEICYKSYGREYCSGWGSYDKKEAESVAKWLSGVAFPYNFYLRKGKYCDDEGTYRCVPMAYLNRHGNYDKA